MQEKVTLLLLPTRFCHTLWLYSFSQEVYGLCQERTGDPQLSKQLSARAGNISKLARVQIKPAHILDARWLVLIFINKVLNLGHAL
jgi:hypothetical protein